MNTEDQIATFQEEIKLLCESRKTYAEAAAEAEAETERFKLFIAGETTLVLQQAKGIFTALTEYDGELQFKGAAHKALKSIAQWERDCKKLLEFHAAAL